MIDIHLSYFLTGSNTLFLLSIRKRITTQNIIQRKISTIPTTRTNGTGANAISWFSNVTWWFISTSNYNTFPCLSIVQYNPLIRTTHPQKLTIYPYDEIHATVSWPHASEVFTRAFLTAALFLFNFSLIKRKIMGGAESPRYVLAVQKGREIKIIRTRKGRKYQTKGHSWLSKWIPVIYGATVCREMEQIMAFRHYFAFSMVNRRVSKVITRWDFTPRWTFFILRAQSHQTVACTNNSPLSRVAST